MTLPRLIPTLLLRDDVLVRAKEFLFFQKVGDPVVQVERYKDWDIDELIYLDITPPDKSTNNGSTSRLLNILPKISKNLFAPLTVGGGVSSVEEFRALIRAGADRVTMNSAVFRKPELITDAAYEFGSQAVVISVDVRRTTIGYEVFIDHGQTPTGKKIEDWVAEATNRGGGEFLVNCIDRDGYGSGFEVPLYEAVVKVTSMPVIACGGCGTYQHVADILNVSGINAVAAGNVFNFTELSYSKMKNKIRECGISIR